GPSSLVREDGGEYPDRRGTPRPDRPSRAADAARERLARAGPVLDPQDVVAVLAAVPGAERNRHGVPRPGQRADALVQGVHDRVGDRAVHEEPGRVRPGKALVLGPVHGRARLCAPQLPARPVHLPDHAVVRRRHARRRRARVAERELPPVGGDLRGTLGPARATLGGRRRGRHAVLRAARAVQPVPAPRVVHQARAEYGVHPRDGRPPLPVLLRAVPLDLRAGEVAVRRSQERGRPHRSRRGARQAHRPAHVDGTPSAGRDRKGPAPRPRPVAPGPRSEALRAQRCASTCSASPATTSWAGSSSPPTSAPWRSWPDSWWPGAWRPSVADQSRCVTRPVTSSIPPPPSPRPGSETVTSSRSSEGDSTMAVWRYAGTLDDIWAGEMRAVNIGAVGVLLCNLDGTLVAYENRCPHLANPLSEGVLADGVLTCAAHEWEFDVRTGRGVNPASACLHRYPVRLDGERIFVGVGEDE